MIVALATAVVLTACGSEQNDAGSPSATTTPASSTSTTSTTTTTTTTTTATGSPSTAPTTSSTGRPPVTTTPVPARAMVVSRGDPSRRVVALTFDAGSDAGSTAQILDTLAANGIPASFGLTGTWVESHRDLAARIASAGHLLINHTYDHPSFTGRSTGKAPLTPSARADQLARTEAAIRTATGRSALPWFRPPYGDYDESVRADVARSGYRYMVMWTVDSLGWKGVPAEQIVARCLDNAVPGAIFLLHVGSASQDGRALQAIIAGLRARGYSFATVAGLLGA
jgi:peptidoglycan/xylan/chitin deacetylase (PgdA/CDA1 family)